MDHHDRGAVIELLTCRYTKLVEVRNSWRCNKLVIFDQYVKC